MISFKILMVLCGINSICFSEEDGSAEILQYEFTRNSPAEYEFSFETSNGLKRSETGGELPSIHDATKNAASVRGFFLYPGADGKTYRVDYVVDEAGFHPVGDHIKVPPYTPWVPGQPIDDGHYIEDNSGKYVEDHSGDYRPHDGEDNDSPILQPLQPLQGEQNYISANRIPSPYQTAPPTSATEKPQKTDYIYEERNNRPYQRTPPNSATIQKNLSTEKPQKPNYFSGEKNYNPYLTQSSPPPTDTQKDLRTEKPQRTNYISGGKIYSPNLSQSFIPGTVSQKDLSVEKPQKNNYITGERIYSPYLMQSTPVTVTQKYLPTEKPPKYISGEAIYSQYLTRSSTPATATPKYIAAQKSQKTNYIPRERILDTYSTTKTPPAFAFKYPSPTITPRSEPKTFTLTNDLLDSDRESTRITPNYLPSSVTPNPRAFN